eukprot:gb/GEZN01008511.1/.p1 GENE.gb/GEZN01008511.1/~~gb/GEZN01008511.1/.p1  ORF type:complete len:431 (-),score=63.06 gb/GEZN01008511.1/:128-1309(-)
MTLLAPPEAGQPRYRANKDRTDSVVLSSAVFELIGTNVTQHTDTLAYPIYINRDFNPEARPTIVFLHGFPDNALSFSNQMSLLHDKGYNVVSPALRGYARVNLPRNYWDLSLYAAMRDLLVILEKLGLVACDGSREETGDKRWPARVHLVGHDWGALVALLAANYCSPSSFSSLTLLSVPYVPRLFPAILSVSRQFLMSWYILFFQFPWLLPERWVSGRSYSHFFDTEAADSVSTASPTFLGLNWLWNSWEPSAYSKQRLQAVQLTFQDVNIVQAAIAWYRHNIFPLAIPGVAELCSYFGWEEPLLGKLLLQKQVLVPTLVLGGALDGCISPELLEQTYLSSHHTSDFPLGIKVKRIQKVGHFPQFSAPMTVSKLLYDWVREKDGAGRPATPT